MKSLKIMEKLDQFLFSKLDELYNKAEFTRILDEYAALDENVQEIIKNVLAAITILIPFLIIVFLTSLNGSIKSDLSNRVETLTLAQEIISANSQVKKVKSKYIASTAINSQAEFQAKISQIASSNSIDSAKLSLANFESIPQEAMSLEARIEVKFEQFSNKEIFTFMSELESKHKIKIEEISIIKDESNNLLKGTLQLVHFGKENIDDEASF